VKVFVVTSDNYLHAMRPFAYLFNKFWPNQRVEVCCHEIPTGMPENFTCVSVGPQKDYTWSSAVAKFLEAMDASQFVLLLEDYFITERPNLELIKGLWEYMGEIATNAGRIGLVDDRIQFPHFKMDSILGKSYGLIESTWMDGDRCLYNPGSFRSRLYLTSLQPAIWRKDCFMEFLNVDEDPWEFEERGSERVATSKHSWRFFGTTKHPFKYCNILKARKPFCWRPERGMPSELWEELKGKELVR